MSLWCQSSLVIWQSGETALSVSTSCGNDTTDLPLITNEAQRGWWEPSEGVVRHPEVERWSADPLLMTSYTITCFQRMCVKRFSLILIGCRSATARSHAKACNRPADPLGDPHVSVMFLPHLDIKCSCVYEGEVPAGGNNYKSIGWRVTSLWREESRLERWVKHRAFTQETWFQCKTMCQGRLLQKGSCFNQNHDFFWNLTVYFWKVQTRWCIFNFSNLTTAWDHSLFTPI